MYRAIVIKKSGTEKKTRMFASRPGPRKEEIQKFNQEDVTTLGLKNSNGKQHFADNGQTANRMENRGQMTK